MCEVTCWNPQRVCVSDQNTHSTAGVHFSGGHLRLHTFSFTSNQWRLRAGLGESCFKMLKVSREVGGSSATESRRVNCVFNVRNVGENGAGGRGPAWRRLHPLRRGEKKEDSGCLSRWSLAPLLIQDEQRAERGLNRTPLKPFHKRRRL